MNIRLTTKEFIEDTYKLSECTSHKEFAKLCELSESAVCRYMKGDRQMNVATMCKILDVLGIDIKFVKKV